MDDIFEELPEISEAELNKEKLEELMIVMNAFNVKMETLYPEYKKDNIYYVQYKD